MKPNSRSAVFIDRDGVINRMFFDPEFGTVDSPANPDQFVLFDGVAQAIANFKHKDLLVIVVSNQPGIAKGKFKPSLLTAIETKMNTLIQAAGGRVDATYNCLHHPQALLDEYRAVCECRKPKPGLLIQAARDWGIDLAHSYMIGDGVTDMVAGSAAGVTTLFVNSRKCYNCDSLAEHKVRPDYIVQDLSQAATVIEKLEAGDKDSASEYALKCA
jgi:histidinol-phosphate phosphatase family protein